VKKKILHFDKGASKSTGTLLRSTGGGTIRYQPTKASAAAWRVFMATHVNKPALSDPVTPEPFITS
jgi:hypothetical protein